MKILILSDGSIHEFVPENINKRERCPEFVRSSLPIYSFGDQKKLGFIIFAKNNDLYLHLFQVGKCNDNELSDNELTEMFNKQIGILSPAGYRPSQICGIMRQDSKFYPKITRAEYEYHIINALKKNLIITNQSSYTTS